MHINLPGTRVRSVSRGFVGLLALWGLAGPGEILAAPVWCSPFETENGTAVTHEQVAVHVDNLVGADGQSTGSISDLPPPLYVQYGVALPGIPGGIDPNSQAAAFGLSFPNDRRTGINTNLRSDAGNLGSALTFEGYFYTPSATPIESPPFVGRRFVTQKRSADDGQSRIAIGLHATRVGIVEGLFDYEGFNYTGTVLHGQAGGTGWAGAWDDADSDFAFLTNDNVSLTSSLFTSVGSRISGVNTADGLTHEAMRPLARSLSLAEEGGLMYISFLLQKTAITAPASNRNLEIDLVPAAGTQVTRFGMTSGTQFFLNAGTNAAGTVTAGTTYLIIGKVAAHAGNDEVFMSFYGPGDTVPLTEPVTWSLTSTISGTNSGATLSHVRMVMGNQLVNGELDEIRVGSTYASVTDPNAPLGNPGTVQNVLSTFWVQTDGSVPPVLTNRLEVGSTPIQANTWYHFAMVHDGTTLTWYLDGNQEGTTATPSIVGPGTAKIAIANNRSSGSTDDRGFAGVMDEVRIYDRALTQPELASEGGAPGANLLWRSRFETNLGSPVTNGQAADAIACIDNSAGPPDGTPSGILSSLYAEYGQPGVPDIPGGIDPGNLGGLFTFSMPDVPIAAVNTNIPSNTGNLANAMTVQGYFYNARTTTVSPGAVVGNRLVSLMRSASQGNSRLAIGLAPNDDVTPTQNVLAVAWADPANVVSEAKGTLPVAANTWYHFAMVYDGTDVRWYLDGQLAGELLAPSLAGAGSAPIIIGNDRATGAGTRGFFGLIDKVVVSDHVIAPTEFMTLGFDACLGEFCNTPFADADNDDDVDLEDFAQFQLCYTGVGGTAEGQCLCFDRDDDDDVDSLDFDAFAPCRSGANVPWVPSAGCP